MVNVDIDNDLYESIKQLVENDRLDYPSIRHFVNKAVMGKLRERGTSAKKNGEGAPEDTRPA